MDKVNIQDLAVFGGDPAFAEKIHVGRPNIGDRARLMERIEDVLDRRWLSNNGPYVQEFERRVAEHAGVKHCVATCNGTVALEIAIRALGLTGEVIVPSFTFIATAHALQWQEITPVFADVLPGTHRLDPASVEACVTPRTTGIIGVHLWGQACEVDPLKTIARRHELKLMFDASHAFGSRSGSVPVGGFGEAEVFSFHATKFVNSLEGGAIVTNDDDLAGRIRLMKNFGFLGYDNVGYVGTNGKMSEFNAAMGLTSLDSVDAFIEINHRNHRAYRDALSRIPGVSLMIYDESSLNNCQYVVAEIDSRPELVSRDRLIEILWAENVLARRYFHPGCHRMMPYRTRQPDAGARLPVTERVASRVLVLPTGQTLSEETIRSISGLIRFCMEHASEINDRFATVADPTKASVESAPLPAR